MVRDEGVALVNLRRLIVFQHASGAGGKSAHVERQHDVLRDHFAFDVENRAARVLRLADDRREPVRKSEFCISWTIPARTRLDYLQRNRIDRHLSLTSRFR
jgi:hypothetical protein